MLETIESFIKKMKDPRRPQGQRYPFSSMMTMILLAGCTGGLGGHPIYRFMESHKSLFLERLDLPHGLPSKSGLDYFLNAIEKAEAVEAFNEWAKEQSQGKGGKWISGDGKHLRSTVVDANGSGQNFLTMVSLYCRESGLCLALQDAQKKEKDEIAVIRWLLEHFKERNVIFTLDALHCQKKQLLK